MQESQVQDRGNRAEIMQKVLFHKRKSRTKFHFRVRKPQFKLRKALFKRDLENVLEFDVEKDGEIIF